MGWLSLNSATCAPQRLGQTCLIASHRRSNPAILRSELVSVLVGFFSLMTALVMEEGHWMQKTVGGSARDLPIIIPPVLSAKASVMPTISGQLVTSVEHGVGVEIML